MQLCWPEMQGADFFTASSSGSVFWLRTKKSGEWCFLAEMNVNWKTARQTANDLYTGLAQLVIRVKNLDHWDSQRHGFHHDFILRWNSTANEKIPAILVSLSLLATGLDWEAPESGFHH